jgi:hypothetical protein
MPSTTFRAVSSLPLLALALAACLALPGPALAEVRSAPLAEAPSHLAKAAAVVGEPPARIAAGVEPLARLAEAERGAADELEALTAWNRAGRRPLQTGIVRPVPLARTVRFGDRLLAEAAGLHAGGAFARVGTDSTVWGTAVEVAGAHRLRLHLEGVDLPAGARMWVYGEDGQAVAFGPELAFEGSLWTPSVFGPSIRLEVELPRESLPGAAGGHGFTIDRVAEIFRLDADGAPITAPWVEPKSHDDCLIDVSCVGPGKFSVVDLAERAVAHIEFVDGGTFACTGGLLNLANGAPANLEPPFLTANHCFDTQQIATTLEAFWDYRTPSCDGAAPPLGSVPRTSGSQLLESRTISDFTLVSLDFPPDRVLLGWNAENPVLPKNTVTHRISHPLTHAILSQQYTQNRTLAGNETKKCGTAGGRATDDLTRFTHSVFLEGGTFGGSSGAPLILNNGQVVGQLLGACGSEETVDDGCSVENDEIDGNFFTTFDHIKEHLGAQDGPPPDGVLTTPELPGFEFEVTITPAGGAPVEGASEADCIAETLCVSGALAGRPEVFVKIIGPRPNGFLWVQISRFTPSQVDVTVRQLSSGIEKQYTLDAVGGASDDVSGLQDRTAFTP